jgi:hypothetical protein
MHGSNSQLAAWPSKHFEPSRGIVLVIIAWLAADHTPTASDHTPTSHRRSRSAAAMQKPRQTSCSCDSRCMVYHTSSLFFLVSQVLNNEMLHIDKGVVSAHTSSSQHILRSLQQCCSLPWPPQPKCVLSLLSPSCVLLLACFVCHPPQEADPLATMPLCVGGADNSRIVICTLLLRSVVLQLGIPDCASRGMLPVLVVSAVCLAVWVSSHACCLHQLCWLSVLVISLLLHV